MADEIIMSSEGMKRFKENLEKHLTEVFKNAAALQSLTVASKALLRDEHMDEILREISRNCNDLNVTSSNYENLIEFCDEQIATIRRYEEA